MLLPLMLNFTGELVALTPRAERYSILLWTLAARLVMMVWGAKTLTHTGGWHLPNVKTAGVTLAHKPREKAMKTEFIKQYAHTWRIFEQVVKAFDQDAWLYKGRGTTTPARLAFHILQGVKYYIEDTSTLTFASGKSFVSDWATVTEEELPSQNDLLERMDELKGKTEAWLSDMDFAAENRSFTWAGKTQLGVVLFLLRHTLYHIGELSSLLNESKKGETADNWVNTL